MNLTHKPYEKLAMGSYYLILSNFSNLIIGAIFWIIMAKMVDPALLGHAMVAIALATTIIGFTGYGVQVTISKYIAEYNARKMPNASRIVLKLGLTIGLAVSGAAALTISLLSGYIATFAFSNPSLSTLIIFAAIAYVPSHTLLASLAGAFHGSQKMEYAFLSYLIFEIARLVVAITLVLSGLDSFGIIIGFSVGSIVASVFGYLHLVPKALPKYDKQHESEESMKHLVKFSSFNYLAVGMRTLSAQIGVIILGTQNFEWAAFYGLSVLIANVIGGIPVAVSRAMLPTASEEWAKGKKIQFMRIFNTAVRLSLLISGFAFLVFMIDPSYALGLLSKSYTEASSALRILVISSTINAISVIVISLLNAANRADSVAKIGLLSSSGIIALTFLLAPVLGIEGAAVAMLVGSVSSLALSLTMLRRKEQLTISIKSIAKPVISICVGLIVGHLLLTLVHSTPIAIIAAVVSYAGFSMVCASTTPSELKTLLALVRRVTKN